MPQQFIRHDVDKMQKLVESKDLRRLVLKKIINSWTTFKTEGYNVAVLGMAFEIPIPGLFFQIVS